MKSIPRNSILLFLTVILLGAGAARSEIIHLKSGQTIEGAIVARTEDSVKIDTGLGIPVTYYLDEIEDIPAPAPGPEITQPSDARAVMEPAPVAASPDPVPAETAGTAVPTQALTPAPDSVPSYENIASLPPWEAPRVSTDEYLDIQARRARAIERELIDHAVSALIEPLTRYWRGLKDAHPLIRKIAESPAGLTVAAILWLGLYAAICYPLMRLSRRLKCGGWLAWVPILQILQLLRVADRSPVWFLILFFPVVNILAFIFVWMNIARRLEQPHWLGYLMLIPGVNVAILWHLALLPPPAPPNPKDDFDTGIRFE